MILATDLPEESQKQRQHRQRLLPGNSMIKDKRRNTNGKKRLSRRHNDGKGNGTKLLDAVNLQS
jgi:hypothetical protein